MPSVSTNINETDKKQGIVGYYYQVINCPICGKPANIMYKTANGKRKIVCSQECANAIR
jgi:uncharacterized protein (DUF2225 family)